jgi:hypothetical protein
MQESHVESPVVVTGKNVYLALHSNNIANENEEIFLEQMMLVEKTFSA